MLDKDQLGIVRGSVAALAVVVAAVGGGYIWVSPQWFGLTNGMAMSDQIAFGLKADLPLLLWLAFCVRVVSKRRFQSAVDRKGSAFGSPSEMIAVPLAVLQNSLEQTVLAFAGHLVLATVLRGPELVLIPLLVAVYLVGRVAFWIGYPYGAARRSFGMALTAAPTFASYFLAAGLMAAGR